MSAPKQGLKDGAVCPPGRRIGAVLATLSVALVLGACAGLPTVGPDYAGPPGVRPITSGPSSVGAPGASAAATSAPATTTWQAPLPHGGSQADLARWWQQFDDPTLDWLQAAAQRDSASIAQAVARIEQAQAAAVAANAAGLPTVDAGLAASRGTINVGTNILLANQARASLLAGWELDLFGRVRRERESALARFDARTDEWHEARVSVAAEVAASYLQLRFCQSLGVIAEADARSRAETARVTVRAADAGFQSPANAALSQASAAEAASRLTAQRAECDVAIKALVALSGEDEPTVRERLARTEGRLPVPRAFTVSSVPAQLLTQRPDLAAAERALAAASADIGVAEGDRYPRLTLNGSIAPLALGTGMGSVNLLTWSIGAALGMPLFDGGRRAANVDAARANYVAAESVYRARVRQAVREVEEALVRLDSASRRESDARQASSGYQQAVNAADVRYRNGLGSLLDLEEARRFSLNADASLAAVQRDRVAAWVALYRALGGGWMNEKDAR
jgi:NodT family efflux transporter outer membrane factor (OMF) lipoprotein